MGTFRDRGRDSPDLLIIDVSTPATPVLRGSYDTSGGARGVFVEGGYAYVADDYSRLQIIELEP